MGKNKALVVPFALWAVIFIVVPLCLIVWYGVTVDGDHAGRWDARLSAGGWHGDGGAALAEKGGCFL